MKQSTGKKTREVTAFLYLRLSRDDNMDGESYSIGNQKKLLSTVAKEKGYTNLVMFSDDGVSGVTMNRPGFNEMIAQLEKNKASAVFVKDMSRLGRNYIEVGRLTEEFFPLHNIRLVAVSDNIDSDEGENELAPIRNLFNEWYARDISKKRRISNKIKGTSGEPLGLPPYGYTKDPENPKRWIVDEEAACVVWNIFDMSAGGMGTEQIAAYLSNQSILTPSHHWLTKGIHRPRRGVLNEAPCHWQASTIVKILRQQEYCGDIINFKTYSKSYKHKQRLANTEENMAVFKDVHTPIVEREVFDRIQSKRGSARKRKTADGERNMFSGLLVCADCGNNLHFHFNQKNHDIKFFSCSNYKGNRGTCDSTHYVRVEFLEQVVLAEIRRLTRFANSYEDTFVQAVMGYSQNVVANESKQQQKELDTLLARDAELDVLFERLYEDNVVGKLSDDRFAKMTGRYEQEQIEIKPKVKALKARIEADKGRAVTTDLFLAAVRKYTRVRKLTAKMLNDLIDKIEIYHAQKVDGVKTQNITIHFNCVGSIEIPDSVPLELPDIILPTRKGVSVAYAPTV